MGEHPIHRARKLAHALCISGVRLVEKFGAPSLAAPLRGRSWTVAYWSRGACRDSGSFSSLAGEAASDRREIAVSSSYALSIALQRFLAFKMCQGRARSSTGFSRAPQYAANILDVGSLGTDMKASVMVGILLLLSGCASPTAPLAGTTPVPKPSAVSAVNAALAAYKLNIRGPSLEPR